ncbi:hypothetical protein [Nostoc sp.]|uniref:hypothetical protein n=1 Tax=Nostoc sp. TaxID=1180 RepID=UPI002FF5AE63
MIHAGSDYDAWYEWDIDLWFEEGKPGLQVLALRLLLGEQSLHPEKPEKPSPLITAIQASRQGQAELSDVLGERIRKAVELLIKESSPAIADRSEHITPLEPTFRTHNCHTPRKRMYLVHRNRQKKI